VLRSINAAALTAALIIPAQAGELNIARKAELTNMVKQDCGSCHGMTMKGGLGSSLLPKDLEETSLEDLAGIILDGVAGTPMPPWRGLLSEEEVKWIATELKQGLKQ
jgi:cytochrome c55X